MGLNKIEHWCDAGRTAVLQHHLDVQKYSDKIVIRTNEGNARHCPCEKGQRIKHFCQKIKTHEHDQLPLTHSWKNKNIVLFNLVLKGCNGKVQRGASR